MDDNAEIQSYVSHLKQNGREMASTRYASALRTFAGYLHGIKPTGKTFDTFTTNDVESYVRSIPNANTANMALSVIRGYMEYRSQSLDIDDPRAPRELQRSNQLGRIKPAKIIPTREKKSLTPEELRQLLKAIEDNEHGKDADLIYAATVVQFYFGARPVELHNWLRRAKINWKDNSMVIMTAKTHRERFLAWHPNLTPYLTLWYQSLPLPGLERWLTRRIKKYSFQGMKVTAKTGRKTVQTQFRLRKIDDNTIDIIIGHTINKIADIYTDFAEFDNMVRDIMVNKHYMIEEKII